MLFLSSDLLISDFSFFSFDLISMLLLLILCPMVRFFGECLVLSYLWLAS